MNFGFSPEQLELRDSAAEFFARESTPAHIRSTWDHPTGRSSELWRRMAEVGLLGVTVPTEHGGLGMNEVDLVLLLEEAGRAALPEPFLETAAIAAPLLAEAGSPQQQAEWLPRIAAGEAIVTVQLADAPLVVDAHVADLLLLQRGDELHAVPAERFHASPQPSMDESRRVFTVEAETSAETLMPGGAEAAAKAYDRGAAGTAALLCGIGRALLERSVEYAKQRQQFGRPIGSFQAVKHMLAETLLVVETARAATWYAAYAIAEDLPDRSEAASIAKSYASDAAAKANDEALQVHGGIGFTLEHDLHLWLKRGTVLEHSYGTARQHRERLARHLFDRLPA